MHGASRNDRTFRPEHAAKLDDPARLDWMPPSEILDCLGLASGMAMADVGAGTGYFAIPAAKILAPGVLFAVDLEPQMLAALGDRFAHANVSNVSLVEGTAAATTLPDASCDVVLLANVWHELDDHADVLRESARILRAGGRVAIVDWRADIDTPPGPPRAHRVDESAVRALLLSAGWRVRNPPQTWQYSYLIMGEKEPSI